MFVWGKKPKKKTSEFVGELNKVVKNLNMENSYVIF